MNEARKKLDKPDDPVYPGGEDETSEDHKAKSTLDPPSNKFPVDESDVGPSTGRPTQEGVAASVDTIGSTRVPERLCLF